MKTRSIATAAMLGLAGPALAQSTTTTTTTAPPPATAPQATPQTAPAPVVATPPAAGASQQVVVNPPAPTAPAAAPAPAPQPPAPAGTTVQVNPNPTPAPAPATVQVNPGQPAATAYPQQPTVVVEERRPSRSPMAIVLTDALYGGGAGALVGLGVGLIEQGDYARDVLIGTGVGLLAGATVGGIHAWANSTGNDVLTQRSHASDGLGTLARDRAMQRPMTRVGALTFRY